MTFIKSYHEIQDRRCSSLCGGDSYYFNVEGVSGMKTDLITEFMGGVESEFYNERIYFKPDFMGSGWWHRDFLRFDKSWDWIMPVWAKFRDLEMTHGNKGAHGRWIYSLQWYLFSSDDPKPFAERMHYAIKWYNSTKQ